MQSQLIPTKFFACNPSLAGGGGLGDKIWRKKCQILSVHFHIFIYNAKFNLKCIAERVNFTKILKNYFSYMGHVFQLTFTFFLNSSFFYHTWETRTWDQLTTTTPLLRNYKTRVFGEPVRVITNGGPWVVIHTSSSILSSKCTRIELWKTDNY